MHTTFPAIATFLVSIERRSRIELDEGVGPDDACAQFVGEVEDLGAFVRLYAGA